MSSLTSELLKVERKSRSVRTRRLRWVDRVLFDEYGTPRLGNYRDPIREIFFILLSAKTTDRQYRASHRALFAAFPDIASIASASVAAVERCIHSGGLSGKRSAQIIAVAKALIAVPEPGARAFLKRAEPAESYPFLLSLPGIGPKSAFCVMMYSMRADVFPVDVNVQRIAERMGIIAPKLKHYTAQSTLASIAPDGCSRTLHVGMVAHGRKICLPVDPKCGQCVLRSECRYGKKRSPGLAQS